MVNNNVLLAPQKLKNPTFCRVTFSKNRIQDPQFSYMNLIFIDMNRNQIQEGINHGTDATKGCRRILMVTYKWNSNLAVSKHHQRSSRWYNGFFG